MKRKILWLGVSFLLVAALVLASCAPAVGEQEEEEEEEEVAPPVGEPQYGGTLTVGSMMVHVRMEAWDPNLSGFWGADNATSYYLTSLIAGDLTMGQLGTGEHTFGGRYLPPEFTKGMLLESWEILQNPLRLVWHIRPGIMWNECAIMEAREFTADDVAYTINRRADDELRGREGDIRWAFIDGPAIVTDRYTVTLNLNYVFPDWPFMLCWGQNTNITPPELGEAGADDWRNHVGMSNGPFILVNHIPDTMHEYERNPNYWDNTTIIDGKEYEIPFVDELIHPIIVDPSAQLAALRTAKLDTLEKVLWVYKDSLNSTNPELREWEVDPWDCYAVYFMQINVPPLSDLRVRRALNMAVDRQVIIDMVYGGYGVTLNGPFPAVYPESLRDPLEKQTAAVKELFSYDPEKARELLADAGYPDGFKTEMVIQSVPQQVDVASLVKDFWADIGVDVELVAMDMASWWSIAAEYVSPPPRPILAFYESHGSIGHCICGDWFMLGKQGGEWRWDDPWVHDAVERWMEECTTVEEQTTLAKEINQYVLEAATGVILPGNSHFRYAWPWVMNYEGESMSKYMNSGLFSAITWIDQELKAEMGY